MDRGGLRWEQKKNLISIIKVAGSAGRPALTWSNGIVNLSENIVEADVIIKKTRLRSLVGWVAMTSD